MNYAKLYDWLNQQDRDEEVAFIRRIVAMLPRDRDGTPIAPGMRVEWFNGGSVLVRAIMLPASVQVEREDCGIWVDAAICRVKGDEG